MTTYRERREARAMNLRTWAGKRRATADAIQRADSSLRADMAFVAAQPGIANSPSWKRAMARERREWDNRDRAGAMTGRAIGIEQQLDRAIYSDDPDAIEALEARIADLEAKRERYKAENVAFRAAHRAELAALTPYGREQAIPHPGYELTNLGGNIRRNKDRLAQLEREAAPDFEERPRLLTVKYGGDCRVCGRTIQRGETALYFKSTAALACSPDCEAGS